MNYLPSGRILMAVCPSLKMPKNSCSSLIAGHPTTYIFVHDERIYYTGDIHAVQQSLYIDMTRVVRLKVILLPSI